MTSIRSRRGAKASHGTVTIGFMKFLLLNYLLTILVDEDSFSPFLVEGSAEHVEPSLHLLLALGLCRRSDSTGLRARWYSKFDDERPVVGYVLEVIISSAKPGKSTPACFTESAP